MSEETKCPNCMGNLRDHPENGCVLATLVQAIRERGNVDEEKLLQMHATTDVSALWEDLGPIIDKLEAGEYAGDDDSEGEKENTYLLKDGTTTTSTYMEGQYVCKHCKSSEVVYQPRVDDATCQICGEWQN